MYIWLTSTSIACALTTLVMFLAFILNNRSITDREKLSPFECGFDPKNSARIPFSMRFFLLAIIFIVFDIEIVLLIPTPLLIMLKSTTVMFTILLFLLILILGLFHEWIEGSLDWSS